MTEFILCYLILSMSAVGLGKLYMYLIQPNQLFEFMQPILAEAKYINVFLYRSIGGCEICTIQRFNDFSFIILLSITEPLFPELHNLIRVLLYIVFYVLYAGLSYYFLNLISVKQNQEKPKIEKSTLHV